MKEINLTLKNIISVEVVSVRRNWRGQSHVYLRPTSGNKPAKLVCLSPGDVLDLSYSFNSNLDV